jgi:excisionase family DNA binding protein
VSRQRQAASRATQATPSGEEPELRRVLRGDAVAWRQFVAYYDPGLRAVVHHGIEASTVLSTADVDDVLGDFWLAALADGMRMLRAFKPERGAALLTWLTFHVAQIAFEHVRRKRETPTFVPLDEARHVAAPVSRGVDDAIRAVVREAITRELREAVTPPPAAPTIATPEYISAVRAAEIAGVRPATIREWASRGRLPSHRAGRLVRIRTDDLQRFLAGGQGRTGVVDIEARRRRALERLK